MDEKEIKEALASDAGKKAIEDAIDDAVKGLKKKNEELLGKLNKAKDEKSDIEKRLDALEDDKTKAEEEAAAKSGDVQKVKDQLEARHKREVDALKGDNEKLKTQLHNHVVGQGLTEALVKAKVAPPLMDAAKALIKSSHVGEVGDNDGTPFAKFDGKAVEDFVTDWAQSETGKHFISADANSGGGSNGANGSGQGSGGSNQKTMNRSEYDALEPHEQAKLMSGGDVSLVD